MNHVEQEVAHVLPFQDSQWEASRNIGLVAPTLGGKSTLITHIFHCLAARRAIDIVVAMSGSETSNSAYEKFLPSELIYENFDEEKISHLIDWQAAAMQNGKAQQLGIILDDVGDSRVKGSNGKGTKKMSASDKLNTIVKRGRHSNIMLVFAVQYLKDFPADVRSQFHYMVFFATPNMEHRKTIWKEFFGMYQHFDDFNAVFEANTANFDCLILDRKRAMKDGKTAVFWYHAAEHKDPFMVGRPQYWKMARKFARAEPLRKAMDPAAILGVDPAELGMSTGGAHRGSAGTTLGGTAPLVVSSTQRTRRGLLVKRFKKSTPLPDTGGGEQEDDMSVAA